MIIAEYGHKSGQSIMENKSQVFSPNNMYKESSSSFDLVLEQLKTNLPSSDVSILETVAQKNEILDPQIDISLQSKEKYVAEKSYTAENTVSDHKKIDEPKPIEVTGPKNDKVNSAQENQHKLLSSDIKYISELNKKMNQLMEKIKKPQDLSESALQGFTSELKNLVFQFQQFVSSIKGLDNSSQVNSSNLEAKVSTNPMMDKLIQGMFGKLENLKDALNSFGLKVQKFGTSLQGSVTGIEGNLNELKKMDQELDKTLELFKELKTLNQNNKVILEQGAAEKFAGKNIPELTMQVEKNPAPKREVNDVKNSSFTINALQTAKAIAAQNNHLSGQSFSGNFSSGQEFKGESPFISPSGVSGGIAKSTFLTDAGFLKDPSAMSMQDKMALGKEVLAQIQNEMKGYIGKKDSHFSISLKPEELGDVKVIMEMKDGVIKSQIVVENEIVKDLLKHRFDEMKNMFQENGVNIAELNVQTQSEFNQENKQFQNSKAIFETHQHTAGQIKLNRIENIEKTNWVYEKTVDNLMSNKEFIITI